LLCAHPVQVYREAATGSKRDPSFASIGDVPNTIGLSLHGTVHMLIKIEEEYSYKWIVKLLYTEFEKLCTLYCLCFRNFGTSSLDPAAQNPRSDNNSGRRD
jgi:hypothetical protein